MYREPLTPEQDAAVSKKTAELVKQAQLKDKQRQEDLVTVQAIISNIYQEK